MCIIAIKPKGKPMFKDETIERMFSANPDGAGFMYYDSKSKKVVIEKGFMSVKALKKALKGRDWTRTNVVMHFRIGTSGFNDKLNCHPYPVYQKNALSCKTDIAMAHNGILTGYIPSKTSDINDTQVFIQNVLAHLKKGFQYDTDKLMLIEEIIGTNRLAFLDSNNKVTTIGNFIEDDGYIYSNTSYKEPRYTYTKSVYSAPKTKVAKKVDTKKSVSTSTFKQSMPKNQGWSFWGDEDEDDGWWKDYDRWCAEHDEYDE